MATDQRQHEAHVRSSGESSPFSAEMRQGLAGFPTGITLAAAEVEGRVVGVLGEQHAGIVAQLRRSVASRFGSVAIAIGADRAVVLANAPAWFTVAPEVEVEAGDRLLALLRVQDLHRDTGQSSLMP